jgi:hypothetical protein
MKHTKWCISLFLILSIAGMAFPIIGQAEPETVVSGLNFPRLMSYGSDGTLYIAEAGTAGDTEVLDATGYPVLFGLSARVVAVAPDATEPIALIENLPSVEAFNNVVGVNAVLAGEDSFAVVIGGTADVEDTPTRAVQILDADLVEQRLIDIGAVEDATNPDNDDVASNPIDIAQIDDIYYIVDASGNALYTVVGDEEPALLRVWEDLPVPSAVAIGPEGDVYVGFLSAFPFTTGSARIERWSAAGELIETYTGLTGVTDIHVDDSGTLYAVEFASGFDDMGWIPDSGRVVRVDTESITPLLEGLNFPYGLAQAPDGTLVVSINSAFSEPGTGAVVRVPLDAAGEPEAPAAPAMTPEAESSS